MGSAFLGRKSDSKQAVRLRIYALTQRRLYLPIDMPPAMRATADQHYGDGRIGNPVTAYFGAHIFGILAIDHIISAGRHDSRNENARFKTPIFYEGLDFRFILPKVRYEDL